MRVLGFIGSSGTGKSYRAGWLAREKGIEYIIDDGLLIKGNSIVSGISAKKEKTKIASIRRALFTSDSHAKMMREAIKECNVQSILILGTSEGMVETIAKKMGFSGIDEKIYITDVADEYEIAQAQAIRKEQGKHVIPVPTFEIKRDFSGYFLDPLRIFKKKEKSIQDYSEEKSVVRPTFSYLGNYTISDYTIFQIVSHIVKKTDGVAKVSRFNVRNEMNGTYIDMDVILYYGFPIKPLVLSLKSNVADELEKLTALNIICFDVTVKSLALEKKE